jgi:hypothetical protein
MVGAYPKAGDAIVVRWCKSQRIRGLRKNEVDTALDLNKQVLWLK